MEKAGELLNFVLFRDGDLLVSFVVLVGTNLF